MTTDTDLPLNEVDIRAVGALVEGVRADPGKAHTTWAAHVTWNGGFSSSSRVRQFAAVPSDEPAMLGGGDSAPNPVEQLLAALGNCLAVGYAANATIAGIRINNLQVDLRGDIDLSVFLGLKDGHAGFESITATVRIDTDASPAQLEALHTTVVASSPVGHTLSNAVPLDVVLA
ncbi:osmotically inducible protein OsmC [Mycobacterium florentinum]|uniref:Osmotically inducible protein OsmC n=1 Tax=Mycobacterium florentinum TaxID=292462 RepID=A0A1X1U7U0_MYCFL|nr:OsmC family protein [Mycobacterium florentinum]MCV7409591.1 OsmC family protein [Mycobacterium florentinum]ORV52729.1 osmotically inducible protein OsmC [Mycobacterium florentinum]BBX78885.1 osmotically inducible protein C [Mycobacterium florentinum]